MLTSIGDPRDVVRCRRIGVDAYLSKPVKHSDLLDALVTVFGVSTRKAPSLTRTTRARTRALRVLVAEDNLVNRKLVTRLLQKRGHRITAVENGRAAVAALTSAAAKRFDVVLMDVQMPEMNGLEATAAIRQHEAAARRSCADHRADRSRPAGRSRALPCRRDGCVSGEADRRRGNDRHR